MPVDIEKLYQYHTDEWPAVEQSGYDTSQESKLPKIQYWVWIAVAHPEGKCGVVP